MSAIKHTLSIEDSACQPAASVDVVEAHGTRFLINLWVDPDRRAEGYATQLLEAAVQTFGHQSMYVHALPYADRPLNEQMLMALYTAFDFTPIGDMFPGGMVRKPNGVA